MDGGQLHVGPFLIRPRRSASQGGIPIQLPDVIVFPADVDWMVQGPCDEIAVIHDRLAPVAELLKNDLLLLRFGNTVGHFDVPGLGRIESRSGKWGSEHFGLMLAELTEIAAGLPFSAGQAAALPFHRSVIAETDVLYHAFVYLRQAVLEARGEENLATAFEIVLADPHQVLRRESRRVSIESATCVGPSAIGSIVCRGQELSPAGRAATLPIAVSLRGHVPMAIDEDVVHRTYDTPENRFAKALLHQVTWLLEAVDRSLGSAGNDQFRSRLDRECSAIRRIVHPIGSAPLWASVGTMSSVPVASTVLQRRRGYRSLFHHYALLRLATKVALSEEHTKHLLETKDIAALYELWCYFSLVDSVTAVLGLPSARASITSDETEKRVRHGYDVTWGNGVRVSYNLSFPSGTAASRRSYSVGLRPDIVLTVPGTGKTELHIFDAKFKIDAPSEIFVDEADGNAPATNAFKREDLYKMHAYRDAILDARSAWVLYPGGSRGATAPRESDVTFFPEKPPTQGSALENLPTPLEGVGAIALRPESGARRGLERVLETLLRRLISGPAAQAR